MIKVLILLLIFLLKDFLYTERLPREIGHISKVRYGIPNIIHRTHAYRYVNRSMYKYCHQEWVRLNPEYKMRWYSNGDCYRYIHGLGDEIEDSYNTLVPGAYKADLWRLYILYEFGGIYVDSYAHPIKSLKWILRGCFNPESEHQFISVKDECGIHNGFIICTPKHPFIKQCILDILVNIRNKDYTDHDLAITGPIRLLRSVNKVLNLPDDNKVKDGWNKFGYLSFYLFSWGKHLYKPIVKNGEIILYKKYSIISLIYEKVIKRNKTYTKMWKDRNVFV